MLNGEKPANTPPVVVTTVPGTEWRYSGGGVCIEQLLMTDVTGRPFPEILRERVFDRIGMTSSTFEQPLPSERAALAASGTYDDGQEVPGGSHIYPETAAAGLWDRMGLGFFLGDSYEDRGAGWDESPSVFLRDAREHEVRDGDPLARVDRDHGALTGIAEEDEGGRKAFVVADVPESIRRARRSTILRSPLR